jgi:hypothetical protein
MLEKLLSLLLHAKAGAISGVFLLGATGALVSVSAQNGVTTITVTQPSASPSASASANPSASASPSANPSASAKPSSSPKPTDACADQAKATAFQVQRVDSAFTGFHTDLMKLRGTRSTATIEKADVMLKSIRQAAVKAIHATMTCKKHDDDEDENDEDDSHDAAFTSASLNSDRENEDSKDKEHGPKASPVTFTGTDAAGIADQAIAAMQAAFDTAKSSPATSPKPSKAPEASRSPKVPQASHKPETHHD